MNRFRTKNTFYQCNSDRPYCGNEVARPLKVLRVNCYTILIPKISMYTNVYVVHHI